MKSYVILLLLVALQAVATHGRHFKTRRFFGEQAKSHPCHDAPPTIREFSLSHVVAFHSRSKELHIFEVPEVPMLQERSLPVQPQSYRDRVRISAACLENSYPPNKLTEESSTVETAYRVAEHANILKELQDANFTTTTSAAESPGFLSGKVNFFGTRTGLDDDYGFGPQIVIYTSKTPNVTNAFFAMRGLHTSPDLELFSLWYYKQIDQYFPDESIDRWDRIGQSPDVISRKNDFGGAFLRIGAELLAPTYKTDLNTYESESTYNQIPSLSVTEPSQYYYGLTKQMMEAILPVYNTTHQITLTGHSFGGAIMQMISVYYAQLGQVYETILMAPVGGRCVSTYQAWTGEDFLDPATSQSHIRAYASPLDPSTIIDWSWGSLCFTPYSTDDVDLCSEVFGQGLNIGLSPFAAQKAFEDCRTRVHQMYLLFDYLNDDSVLLADGTTNSSVACLQWDDLDNAISCPSVKFYPAFWGAVAFIIILIVSIIALIVWAICGCVRCCKHELHPCCCCCRCGGGLV